MLKKIRISLVIVCLTVFSLQAQEHVSYKIEVGDSVESISKKLGLTTAKLLTLNPVLKNGVTEGQFIIIPNPDYTTINNIEKGDYVENGILFHKVLPKENYSLFRRKYGVNRRELRKYNLTLRRGGIKAGSTIQIPVDEDFRLPTAYAKKQSKPYLVLPQQTKWMIARQFGISVEDLNTLNPKISTEILQANTVIRVPNRTGIPEQNENYIYYQVVKDDNFFNLSQRFQTTKEQLIALNPGLVDGVKLGAVIMIKKVGANMDKPFVPLSLEGKKLKVALLLPFKANENVDFSKQKTANYVTDFYLGAMMALDSLRKQGLSIDLLNFDSENKKETVLALYQKRSFDQVDAIIGPMYYDNVRVLAPRVRVPLVSPVSDNDHAAFAGKSTVQATVQKDVLTQEMMSYIKAHYDQQEFIVVIDDVPENQPKFNALIAALKTIDSIKKIRILKPQKGFIKSNLFKQNISENKENWVLLLTEDSSVTTEVIQNLGVLPEKVQITLFTLAYDRNFDSADNNFLARLNFHFPTSNFIDYEAKPVQDFVKAYTKKNYLEPSDFSFRGFDVTYDAVLRIANSESLKNPFTTGKSERYSTRFNYVDVISGKGVANAGAYIVKYDGLHLKLAQ